MKRYSFLTLLMMTVAAFMTVSCSDEDTYADQKERERDAIKAFLERDICIKTEDDDTLCYVGKINPISEVQFAEQGDSTSLEKNEYVLFGSNGVYMQIVRRGIGEPLADSASNQVICQFLEYNIMGDSLQLRSETNYWAPAPDIMNVSNNGGTILATFSSAGAMPSTYGSTVPSGWLVPLKYIGLGRKMHKDEDIALVRLIVPHSQGHQQATQAVYPCFYEIKYQEVSNPKETHVRP